MAQSNSRILLEPAYVLHQRPYRDSSLLLEVFSLNYGRVGLVARGVKGKHKQRQALLQAFVPVQLSWSGRGDLATLTDAEANGVHHDLTGQVLLSGFYLNELLIHLLHRHDPHPELFEYYRYTLQQLDDKTEVKYLQRNLRLFEYQLLHEIGYGLALDNEIDRGEKIDPDEMYRYYPGEGPRRAGTSVDDKRLFSGNALLAFGKQQLDTADELRQAKRLTRLVLEHYLGGRQLHSRKLLMDMQRTTDAAARTNKQYD